jgi:hypothetical protein
MSPPIEPASSPTPPEREGGRTTLFDRLDGGFFSTAGLGFRCFGEDVFGEVFAAGREVGGFLPGRGPLDFLLFIDLRPFNLSAMTPSPLYLYSASMIYVIDSRLLLSSTQECFHKLIKVSI